MDEYKAGYSEPYIEIDRPTVRIRFLSLGWGLQSWTLAAMAALGELPPVDCAIHADTLWERQETYDFARQWTPWLEERGVRVVTVRGKEDDMEARYSDTHLPTYTLDKQGRKGQSKRQCTKNWKIKPMRQFITREIRRRKIPKVKGVAESWLGISRDEWHRAKDSDAQFLTHRFPLLEMNFTRADCAAWLLRHNLPVPVKSSCVFCPYHDKRQWQELRRLGGSDWETAVKVDAGLRNLKTDYDLFVHRNLLPLPQAVILTGEIGVSGGEPFDPWSSDDADAECDSGYCFL